MINFDEQTGYIPGIIGRIAELHALYYSRNWHFSHYFEAKVASELSDFVSQYDEERDCIWSLSVDGVIEGAVAIDSSSEAEGIAHLRWFIISDRIRGSGAGNLLMERAMSFCSQKGFEKVYLWTFQGLDAARHLYEKFGFSLKKAFEGDQWGTTVTEQYFEIEPAAGAILKR